MNIDWFKKEVVIHMNGFEISYSNFTNENQGNLFRVEFKNDKLLGGIDFWEQREWIDIHVIDLDSSSELLNEFLKEGEDLKKKAAMEKLVNLLKKINNIE